MTREPARIASPSFLDEPPLARLFAALAHDGDETRVVGGAVRDALLGVPVGEVDLATTALPKETMKRAQKAGLRCIPTGIDHGTVTILVDGVSFEVTTLREDVETDGRHAKVRFGRSFEQDALRRDFTMNALSVTPDGTVHDYAGGLDDLARRHVRFIGAPRQRIREDYLRILRYFRFHAAFGEGEIDSEALAAIIAERDGLATLSRERVRSELLKLLVARRAVAAAREMSDVGILPMLLAGIALPARLARLVAIERARTAMPDALLRLIALAGLVADDAVRLGERLRLSNAEIVRAAQALAALVEWHGYSEPPAREKLRVFLFAHGRRAACDAATLAHAESGAAADDAAWTAAWRFLAETPEPRLPFSGADLIARGVPTGRTMGEALKRLQARWIRAGFPKDPATLARLLDDVVSSGD